MSNNSFQVVIANLNTSLRNAETRGYGDVPHCYVRADELAALIRCASILSILMNAAPQYGLHQVAECCKPAINQLEACDHE